MVVGGRLTLGTLLFATQLMDYAFGCLARIAMVQADFLNEQPVFQRGKDFVALPDGDSALPEKMEGGHTMEEGRTMEERHAMEEGHAMGEGHTMEERHTMEEEHAMEEGHLMEERHTMEELHTMEESGIRLKNAAIMRPDGSRLVQIEDFTVRGPGLILIRGENGCGKSTLFNILSGVFSGKQLETAEGGSCEFSDLYRNSLGYLFYPNFVFSGTVKENVLYGRNIPDREFERVHMLLNLPPADKEVQIKPENLSLGEKQKIYLARLFLGNYKCFFLDEPGSNLDDRTEENLISILKEMKQNRLLLVIRHNDRYDRIADRIYMIKDGRMAAIR